MAHNHNHHHSHDSEKNIGFAFFLNFSFVIIELIGGFYTNSMAILSDALHDLGDSVALGLTYFFEKKSSHTNLAVFVWRAPCKKNIFTRLCTRQ